MATTYRNSNGNRNGYTNASSVAAPWVVAVLGIAGFLWSHLDQTVSKTDILAVETRIMSAIDQMSKNQQEANNRIISDMHDTDTIHVKTEDEIKKTMASLLPISLHMEYANRKDKDTDRLEKEIDAINSDLVKRSEHMQHWTEQAERTNAVRDQVLEIRRDLTGSASIGKQFEQIITAQRADREAFQAQILEMRRVYDTRQLQPVSPIVVPMTPNAK